MSAETYAALEAAIAAHVADHQPNFPMVTDWYLITAGVGDQHGQTGYLHVSSEPMPTHVMFGLVGVAHDRVHREAIQDDDD